MQAPLEADVGIVGGGPVGLHLGLELHARDVSFRVIERRREDVSTNAAIGLHPPALDLLDRLGLTEELLTHGVRIRRGVVFGEQEILGAVELGARDGRHGYILSVLQRTTERVLREALLDRRPGAIIEGAAVALTAPDTTPTVVLDQPREGGRSLRFRAAVGCDGRHGTVRSWLGLRFDGAPSLGVYAMADCPDRTGLGNDAALFLSRAGLVESFPLPGSLRRWVARCDDTAPETQASVAVTRAVASRVPGWARDRVTELPRPEEATGARWFRAERCVASRLAMGNVALAGDAAHVVSPVGGHGMNLGWLGASSIADAIAFGLADGAVAQSLHTDALLRARIAQGAARRAEVNMWIAQPGEGTGSDDAPDASIDELFARALATRGVPFGV